MINIDSINIFHITHIENLPHILSTGGLCSDVFLAQQDRANINIAHEHIKERRRLTPVAAGPGGFVAEYVPFYFCSRSPMLFSIHRGNVAGYEGGQKFVIHLCAKLAHVIRHTSNWCFSDGHTDIPAFCNFYDDINSLSQLDWDAIKTDGWGYPYFTDDFDLKRRKQAEFLVHNVFPWNLFIGIGVFDEEIKEEVEAHIQRTKFQPPVKVIRKWYY